MTEPLAGTHGAADAAGPVRPGGTALRITISGTHNRRSDLEALNTWLAGEKWFKDAQDRGELQVERPESETQPESMLGAVVTDILLIIAAEALLRPVADMAWSSVRTWLNTRRRHANEGEYPQARIEGDGVRRDSGEDRGDGQQPGETPEET